MKPGLQICLHLVNHTMPEWLDGCEGRGWDTRVMVYVKTSSESSLYGCVCLCVLGLGVCVWVCVCVSVGVLCVCARVCGWCVWCVCVCVCRFGCCVCGGSCGCVCVCVCVCVCEIGGKKKACTHYFTILSLCACFGLVPAMHIIKGVWEIKCILTDVVIALKALLGKMGGSNASA